MPDSPEPAPPDAEVLASLHTSWRQLAAACGAPSRPAEAFFAELVQRYSEPQRHYHNLSHVRQVLATVERFAGQVSDLQALRWAAWFHDAVYDPRAGDNEERSAEYAARALAAMHVRAAQITAVRDLVLQTKTHQPPDADPHSQVFLDADLAILGADEETYAAYARAIRREYDWVPEEQYRAGRARVLRVSLDRPRIFQTSELFIEREARARANIARELAGLWEKEKTGAEVSSQHPSTHG
jgi:predicted metal-dependent HD superfamily phosphohydrolase